MTNNSERIVGLQGYSLEVVEQIRLAVEPRCTYLEHLKTIAES